MSRGNLKKIPSCGWPEFNLIEKPHNHPYIAKLNQKDPRGNETDDWKKKSRNWSARGAEVTRPRGRTDGSTGWRRWVPPPEAATTRERQLGRTGRRSVGAHCGGCSDPWTRERSHTKKTAGRGQASKQASTATRSNLISARGQVGEHRTDDDDHDVSSAARRGAPRSPAAWTAPTRPGRRRRALISPSGRCDSPSTRRVPRPSLAAAAFLAACGGFLLHRARYGPNLICAAPTDQERERERGRGGLEAPQPPPSPTSA